MIAIGLEKVGVLYGFVRMIAIGLEEVIVLLWGCKYDCVDDSDWFREGGSAVWVCKKDSDWFRGGGCAVVGL